MAEERFHMMAIAVVFAMFFVGSAVYLGGGTPTGNTVYKEVGLEPHTATYVDVPRGVETHTFSDSDRDGLYDTVVVDSGGDSANLKIYNNIESYKNIYSDDKYIVPKSSDFPVSGSGTSLDESLTAKSYEESLTSICTDEEMCYGTPVAKPKAQDINKQPFLKSVNDAITFGSGLWMLMNQGNREDNLWSDLGKIADMLSAKFWISEICAGTSSVETTTDNGVFTGDLGGFPIALVNVKGEKSIVQLPNATDPNIIDTKYYYKIEYWVSYPDGSTITNEDEIKFYVQVSGDAGTYQINSDLITVAEGSDISATGTDMIYQGPTYKDYSTVCLVFSGELVDYDGQDIRQICDTFNSYTNGASGYTPAGGSSSSSNYNPDWATD